MKKLIIINIFSAFVINTIYSNYDLSGWNCIGGPKTASLNMSSLYVFQEFMLPSGIIYNYYWILIDPMGNQEILEGDTKSRILLKFKIYGNHTLNLVVKNKNSGEIVVNTSVIISVPLKTPITINGPSDIYELGSYVYSCDIPTGWRADFNIISDRDYPVTYSQISSNQWKVNFSYRGPYTINIAIYHSNGDFWMYLSYEVVVYTN